MLDRQSYVRRTWWVIVVSSHAGVLLQSRPLPEPHPKFGIYILDYLARFR